MSKEREKMNEEYVEDIYEEDLREESEDVIEEENEMTNLEHFKGIHKNNIKWFKKNWKKIVGLAIALGVTIGVAAAILSGQEVDIDSDDSDDDWSDATGNDGIVFNDDGSCDVDVPEGILHMEFNGTDDGSVTENIA